MSPERDAAAVPDLVLERYRLGELPQAEADALARRLPSDEGLRRRLEALDRSDEEIRRRQPAGWLADRVRDRLERERPPWAVRASLTRHWPIPAALAAAATLLMVLTPRVSSPPPVAPATEAQPAESPGDRIKGLQPALALFRKTTQGSEALAEGEVARAGDLIRVGYRAAGRPYGVILSLDGRGAVTLHLPARAGHAARLRSGDVVLLDNAYELDDAPRWECFILVTAESPFDVAPVLEAARGAAAATAAVAPARLNLPRPLEQSAFLIAKENRP
jgi:hypothetical protein